LFGHCSNAITRNLIDIEIKYKRLEKMGAAMKKIFSVIIFTIFTVASSGILDDRNQSSAQYPPPPRGCCKQRDWLAGNWYKTELTFEECDEINRNRDNLDNIYQENGYVWWDPNCDL
jgi:hypothetical protein